MFHFYSKHIRGSFNQIQPLSSSLFASQLSQSMSYDQCPTEDNRHWTGLDMDQHQHRESKMLWPGFHCVRKWKILALKTHIKGGGGGGHVHFFSYTYHPHTRCILFSTRNHSPVQSRSIPLSRNLIYHNNGFIAQPELAEEAVGDVDASKRRWKASNQLPIWFQANGNRHLPWRSETWGARQGALIIWNGRKLPTSSSSSTAAGPGALVVASCCCCGHIFSASEAHWPQMKGSLCRTNSHLYFHSQSTPPPPSSARTRTGPNDRVAIDTRSRTVVAAFLIPIVLS